MAIVIGEVVIKILPRKTMDLLVEKLAHFFLVVLPEVKLKLQRLGHFLRLWSADSGYLQSGSKKVQPYRVEIPVQRGEAASSRPLIVHLVGNFLIGGSSRLIVDLVEGIPEYRHLIITRFNPSPPSITGVRIEECWGLGANDCLISALEREKPVFVHHHFWPGPWNELVGNVASRMGIPTIQNVNVPCFPLMRGNVKSFVFVSKAMQQEFGSSVANAEVIYPGTDTDYFSQEKLTENSTLGMVYRLDRDKLSAESLAPFIETLKMNPEASSLIVGDGRFFRYFQWKVKRERLEERMEFPGMVSYMDLPSLFARMRIFVCPVRRESFGHVSVMAMSMGIPVVGYRVGALPEIIGRNDLLAEPGDSLGLASIIAGLLNDRAAVEEISQENIVRARTLFSKEKMIHSYRTLYHRISGSFPVEH